MSSARFAPRLALLAGLLPALAATTPARADGEVNIYSTASRS